MAADGHQTAAMIVLNDAYGTGLRDATQASFEAAGGSIVAAPVFNPGDTNFSAQISEALAASPDAIVLITFDEAKTIVPALVSQFPKEKIYFVDGNLADYSEVFEPGTLTGAKGTAPGLDPDTIMDFLTRMDDNWVAEGNAKLDSYLYGPESYDAVVLIALAALAADSTNGVLMAGKLQEVSGGSGSGTKCTSFAECADIIIGGGVADYDGISSPVTFDEYGDPTQGNILISIYGDDNKITAVKN
jgi:branched-chain amino acid transport system substrate-binding protein